MIRFLKNIKYRFKKNIADKLYKELQEYKNDLYFQLIELIIMDLINMRERMRKIIKHFSKETDEKKLKFLKVM